MFLKQRPRLRILMIIVVMGLTTALLISSFGRRPANSAGMTVASERTRWMAGRVSGRLPTPIIDAHFHEQESKIPSGHMGVGYSMWWLNAKIEIDPKDAAAWAARTKPISPNRSWRGNANPLHNDKTEWSMPPEDFDGATWYDPTPLFSTGAHWGYIGGYMIITKAENRVYFWQHWR